MSLDPLLVQPTNGGSANLKPFIWSYEYIQSLRSNYVGDSFRKRVEKLKEEVRIMLIDTVVEGLHQLELIDMLQRLGLSYHFEDEIKIILSIIHSSNDTSYQQKEDSLYAVALEFRLLRQHGFDVSAEIFSSFWDEKGSFKPCLYDDCKGILYLYEAAYLLEEGEESIFHAARNFTTIYLKEYAKLKHNEDEYLSTLVNHALELPFHWRMLRLEARWFIDVYGRSLDMNPLLLEFAKLDFNFVQATHQEDLKYVSRWWRNTSPGDHLNSAKDRLMESFLWAVGSLFEPQNGYCRILVAKVNALIATIADVYDVNGNTLEELELFTDTIERWEVSAMKQLPHYLKICFLAVYNSINEIACDALKQGGVHIIPYLKKAWTDLCKSYLLEAKWYNNGYVPTLEEFLDNAWISTGTPLVILHVYCSFTNPTRKEAFHEYHNIVNCISLVIRYANDLRTALVQREEDVPRSIQCYMHESGASKEDAREYLQQLIITTWMKINKDRDACNNSFISFGRNAMRMALSINQYRDEHGIKEPKIKNYMLSLFVNPIPCTNYCQRSLVR